MKFKHSLVKPKHEALSK